MECPGQGSQVTDVWAPWPQCQRFKPIHRGSTVSNDFKSIQNYLNLIQPKTDLPKLQKFEIKYGFDGFDERKNFLHRDFSRFKMNFKLKFRESKV
jgi:hypothetical protein